MKSEAFTLESAADDRSAVHGSSRDRYVTEVITDFESLQRLKDVWECVLQESGIEHPFLCHEWISCWWQCFGTGHSLYIVVIRDQGRVCAILPLMKSRVFLSGVRVRRLGSLFNEHTPRSGFMVTGNHTAVYAEFWGYLLAHHQEWDVLELCQFPGHSTALSELAHHAHNNRYRTGIWCAPPSPYLPISGNWDSFLKSLRGGHRTNTKRQLRRLSETGTPVLETISECELDDALAEGFRLEASAWKGAAGTAIAVQPVLRRFYTMLAVAMAQKKRLRLHFLSVNSRRIAFQYCLQFRNKLFMLKPGYDPGYARYSPSNLLTGMVLEDGFRNGIAEYDFLGQDDAWKLKWTRHTRPHRWLYIFSDSWRGTLLHLLKFRLGPAVKKARRIFARCRRPLHPQDVSGSYVFIKNVGENRE